MIIKIKKMRNEVSVNGAAVTIPMEAVESVNARFVNTLYGYFIGDRLAFPLVENYVKNTWAKYGLKRIQLHEEFFLFQFNTKEGIESVLDNGPWLIRRVPLLLNEWTANTIVKKDKIKRVPVWVKMHHVPIVAYFDVGLSLISTQIGKPLMLDSYTSNMCLNSWGRSAYARVLIEIAADVELMKSLIITILVGNKEGHTFAMIDIEYEWTPPRCASCRIFDHVSEKCPKLPKVALNEKVIEEGFIEKQVEGVRLNKPTLNLQYRRVDKGKSSKTNNRVANKESTYRGPIQITTKNSFSALSEETDTNLKDKECVNAVGQTPVESQFVNDSDEDVDEYITMEEPSKAINNNQGASTPVEIMECVTTTSFSISINGLFHGYFEGKRGLRQGNPLSPYLFTLILEVFTLMLKRRVSETSTFTYHRFCSELDLINLCFADDLCLFAHGDVNSVKVIKDALDDFKDTSDRLPVKYLGVPLVSSRLISRDCKELIDKVQNRVNDWKNKSLLIAGRLQLIQSILSSIHVYWASVFMLPSRVLLDIEQIMRGFLWLDHFNKALMMSHVWKLLSFKESLWVKWIHVYKLKNRSFWDIPYRGKMS
uniref:DUF4283 domain-containing protein n=1 Tax=Tanacetum cinerariifolium TaxID=118510 RepID=A0A6L2JSQ7_TANCI|nr:hypothetical protein [Tanacetum cinerariifolium]